MQSYGLDQDEYEPLVGSAPRSNMKRNVLCGIGIFALGVVALSSSGTPDVAATNLVAGEQLEGEVPVAESFSPAQYDLIYNFLSFAIAAMGSATVFFFFQFSLVRKQYRTALVISALVTLIAFYHYVRIFNSFTEAYTSMSGVVTATGVPFNDAYRYVDWLLTVPLLLIEIILVMRLDSDSTRRYCVNLGSSAAAMIILGYPGEISDSSSTRWLYWILAMIPFLFIVYTLFFGLSDSISKQPVEARGLVSTACWVTVVSWCTYPVVYIFPMLGLTGFTAKTAIQVGYTIADVIAKPVLGLLVWQIAAAKSEAQDARERAQ